MIKGWASQWGHRCMCRAAQHVHTTRRRTATGRRPLACWTSRIRGSSDTALQQSCWRCSCSNGTYQRLLYSHLGKNNKWSTAKCELWSLLPTGKIFNKHDYCFCTILQIRKLLSKVVLVILSCLNLTTIKFINISSTLHNVFSDGIDQTFCRWFSVS